MFDESPVRGGSIWRDVNHRRARPAEKQRTAAEREIIATLERLEGRKLTEQEINLSLEQARALGEL